ncbi:hypothetical protein MAJ_09749, partial [Metarhizium majus ARSEF 297]
MGASGECQTRQKSFRGPLAPLDEDLSLHFRGPFHLKEFAVYNTSGIKKRDTVSNPEKQKADHIIVERTDTVVATINGQVVSWRNNWLGPQSTGPVSVGSVKWTTSTSPASTPSSHQPAPLGGEWRRVAYYSAERRTAQNVVFLGNYGGQGSGLFDNVWGNSLSYLNADGNGGSSSAQILKDVSIPSNTEFSIFSAERCGNSCGFSRASDVAYKGFEGANKIFLFHFKMPLDGDRGFNGDMPALWALNGRIPRTAQYNSCSCWTTGCGEVDIFEALAKGDRKCISAFHLTKFAQSPNWFDRPVDRYVKVAVMFLGASSSVVITKLPYETEFSDDLKDSLVESWSGN